MSLTASEQAPSTKTDAFIDKFRVAPYKAGSLTGLTFAVKDLIDIGGRVTGCGNPTWLERHTPAAVNAVCVDQLLSEGALCMGKTITDELAFDLLGENHFYGTPLNPKAPDRVPGGSSSGSAAAVSGGEVDFALGTDSGGSVRVPASNCGLFGYRPSHGAISVAGVNQFAPCFDTVGVLAPTAEMLTKVCGVLLCTGVPTAPPIKRFLLLKEAFTTASDAVRAALEKPIATIVSSLGLKQEELSVRRIDRQPTEAGMDDWLSTYRLVQSAEIWSALGPWIEANQPTFGPRIAKNFSWAGQLDRSLVAGAVHFRETLFRRCLELLDEGDLICIPTVPDAPPMRGAESDDRDQSKYVLNALSLTSFAGICRMPQVTMPVATVDGAPIGLSLLARSGSDITLLGAVLNCSRQFKDK